MHRRCVLQCLVALFTVAPALAADLVAELDWSRRAALGIPLSGVVREVAVRPGQRVARNDLLVALDDRLWVAQVAQAKAALQQARNDRDEARRELDRALELFERALLSEHERQQAEIDAAAANAAYERARLAATAARLALEYSRLRAPFAGVVSRVHVSVGEAVISALQAKPLVELVDDQHMIAVARVSAKQARTWPAGTPARVAVAGEWYDGQVIGADLEPSGEGKQGTVYPLRVAFKRPADLPLRAGERVEVRIGE